MDKQSKLIDVDQRNVTIRRGSSEKKKSASENSNLNSARSSRNNSSSGKENSASTVKQVVDSDNLKDILDNLANKKEFRHRLKINRSSSNDNEKTLNENLIKIEISGDKLNFKSKSSSSLSDSCFTSTSSSSAERPASSRINQLIAALNGQKTNHIESNLVYEDLRISKKNGSFNLTDRLFEKFCMISNDDIMNYASVSCLESLDLINSQNESIRHKLTIKNRITEADKINSKLLNEVLNEPITPSPTDLSQNVFKFNVKGDQIVSQTLASRYQEYVKNCNKANEHLEPKNYFSVRNLIVDGQKISLNKNDNDDGFDDQEEDDDDDVFLKSRPKNSQQVIIFEIEISFFLNKYSFFLEKKFDF